MFINSNWVTIIAPGNEITQIFQWWRCIHISTPENANFEIKINRHCAIHILLKRRNLFNSVRLVVEVILGRSCFDNETILHSTKVVNNIVKVRSVGDITQTQFNLSTQLLLLNTNTTEWKNSKSKICHLKIKLSEFYLLRF